MTHSWSYFPDLCLLLIFKNLSMSDMICSVGLVCTNWARVQRDELSRRHALVITYYSKDTEETIDQEQQKRYGSHLNSHVYRDDGLPWVQPVQTLDQIEFDALHVPDEYVLTEGHTTPLMDNLPNITHLTVKLSQRYLWPIPALDQVTRLVDHYATSLVSLELDFDFFFLLSAGREIRNDTEALMLALFDSINRLESLRHLTLNVHLDFFLSIKPQLSILSRLSTFKCNEFCRYSKDPLLASLRQWATTGEVRVDFGTDIPLKELNRLGSQLAAKFTRVRVSDNFNETNFGSIDLFCERFVSLHSLLIDNCTMPMSMLARCLSQLPELINLKLGYYPNSSEERSPQHEIVQMPSVLLLTLTICIKSHLDTERLQLPEFIPNLQVLHLDQQIKGCEECGYGSEPEFGNEPHLESYISHCMRLARLPFRLFEKLHTVKIDTDNQDFQRLVPQGLIPYYRL